MEYINNLRWSLLADHVIDLRGEKYGQPGDKHTEQEKKSFEIPSESCVIHYQPEYAHAVFNALEQQYLEHPKLKYILISSDGDCGISYQAEHPVASDFKKAIYMFEIEKLGYRDLHLPVRCDIKRCNLTDKFSIKMYAYTFGTFNRLPLNVVRLYTVNNDTDEDSRIISIPFGVPEWFEAIAAPHFVDRFNPSWAIKNRIYVAFQMNTTERHEFMYRLHTNDSYLVRRETVSHEQYVLDLMTCGMCLSPYGNGMDCYRNLESLYLGVLPIIPHGRLSKAYQGLPFINYGGNALESVPTNYAGTRADMNYWRNRINADKDNLL